MPRHTSHHPYARHYRLFQNINDAVYTVNMAGNFTSINTKGAKLLGYSKKEILQMNFKEVVVPEYLEIVQTKIKEKLVKNTPTVYEVEVLRKNGTHLPVEINSIIIFEHDKPIEIIGVARDLTSRVQNLLFTSMATHELKNPLTSLHLYAQLLEKGLIKTSQDKLLTYAQSIKAQSTRLLELIEDLLEISRLQSAQFSMHRETFNIDTVIHEVIKVFEAAHTKHPLRAHCARNLKVHADRGRITQVITNLISNAIKYSPAHLPILITAEADNDEITIGVKDLGPGIPGSIQKKLFNPFYRSQQKWQQNIKGHGLGLVICKMIVESHGGQIWVDSKKNQGVTFKFTLPKS